MADESADLMLGDELAWEPMRLVPPDPWTGHLSFAFWLIKAQRPRTLVELGTHSGNSYFAFCQAMASLNPTGRAFAVDTWAGDEHAGTYDEAIFADVTRFNSEHFLQFSTLLRTTFDDARKYFPDGSIDLLHIDGMHTYDAVRHDFEFWRSALSPRAVVVFHDTNVRERDFGVWRFWRELTAEYPAFEFDHSNGLGVLGFGLEQPARLQALFALAQDAPAAGAFRRRLAARGEAFQRQVQVVDLRLQLQNARRSSDAAAVGVQAQASDLERLDQAKTTIIETLRSELELRVELLETTRGVIETKDAVIAALHNLVAARTQVVDVRDRMIDARDKAADQALQQLRHQEFLTREERRVREEMQQGYENAIANIDAERAALHRGVQGFWQQATDIYVNSFSWKITRPLRIATRLLRGQDPRRSLVPAPVIATSADASQSSSQSAGLIEATSDVAVSAKLKQAMRGLLSARLDAFLAGPETLRLPYSDSPEISIILVLYNQAELTFGCLSSIVETLADMPSVEVVIADNGSTDRTTALLNRTSGATIIRNAANLHFLKAVNFASGRVRGRNILLLNNDAQLLPGSVASALRTLSADSGIGAVGGRIILPDGTLQEAGSIIWRDGACSGYARGQEPTGPDVMFQRDIDYCSGANLLTPTALFQKLGGFDERFAPAYYEETDYCVRLWESGYRVVYDPDAVIVHYEFGSASTDSEALRQQQINHEIFVSQHREWLSRQFPASPLNILAARTARSSAPRILVIEDRVPRRSWAPVTHVRTGWCTSWSIPARR
jgi:GT2 family glycosyltransferase